MTNNTNDFDNIGFIKYLNRLVLKEAEEAMTLDLPGDDRIPPEPVTHDPNSSEKPPPKTQKEREDEVKRKNILKRRNRMYGKNPLIWAFDKIADIEIKLGKHQPPAPPEQKEPIDEKDAALVKHYLARQQQTDEEE